MKRLCIALLLFLLIFPAPAQALQPEGGGKSAVLMEISTGQVLYEHNSHEKLPPASVTKVMTLRLIMEAIDSGKIRWEDTVTASETAAAKGGSQIYLKVGETMTVSDMVKSIAVSSANDCACAMAEHIAGSESAFVGLMNQRAQELGMTDTTFVNCTGLDDAPDAQNHKTSAQDIALMSRELLKNHPDIKKFTTIWMDTVRNGTFGLSNTNKLIRFYDGATGLKTGYTAAAGYCLSASAEREGMGLIAVVMGAETSQKRNAACKSLLDYGFANFTVITPELPEPEPIRVKLSTADTVDAVLSNPQGLLIDKARKNGITMDLSVLEEVTAPVEKGQRLGTLTVKSGDEVLQEFPLTANQDIPRLTWSDLFLRILKRVAMAKS